MNKYKIAIFDHVGKKSGMDCYDSSLMYALHKQGCKTTIFSNYIGIQSGKIEYKPVYEGFSKTNRLLKLYKFILATISSSSNSKRKDVDLVILHLFSTGFISLFLTVIPKLFHLKIAVISHDVSSFKNNDNRFIQNLIYNYLADFIILHNTYSYDYMLNSIQIKNINKLHIIKHGGYLDHVQNINKQKTFDELGLKPSKKYLLFFGQIKKTKGLDILLEALSNINQDTHLIIAGKPWNDNFSYYEKIISDNKLNNKIIKKIRFIEDDERDKLFAISDMIIIPYKKIYQSGVILMAMSYGLPIMASDLPANKQLISPEKNGFLFKSEDVDDLTIKINQYINNDILLENISINATQTIKLEYSWDDIANNYLQLIKSI